MNLYCITSKHNKNMTKLLNDASQKEGLTFINIDEENYDFDPQTSFSVPHLVYRISETSRAMILEKLFITPSAITFRNSEMRSFSKIDNVIYGPMLQANHQIPTPKTIFVIPNDPNELQRSFSYLGGFPLIIKTFGGSKGVGVIKVDSQSSALSVIDYLKSMQTKFVLREFIDVGKPVYSCRAIVLGKEVIFSYRNESVSKEEFRSNIDQKKRHRFELKLSPEEKNIIVKAVSILGIELGAVDFLYDQQQQIKILEVNFPFNFVPVVQDLGFPIHEYMVEYLIQKSQKDHEYTI